MSAARNSSQKTEIARQVQIDLVRIPQLSNLGPACQALGEFARAEQLFAAIALNDLAILYEARGKLPAALELLEQAIAAAPAGQSRARMLANLRNPRLKTGDRPAAVQAIRTSLQKMETALGPAAPRPCKNPGTNP